ncbi:MAG: gamma-glutamyl-gamma-aminobutyrate hydrolase family protein [Deltaproteobacteria bacterium]
MRPIIGISADYSYEVVKHCLGDGYVASVRQAGGSVIILPPSDDDAMIEEYLDICHGLILSGGGDIDPAFWGELPSPRLGEINPRRDGFELALARRALERDIPILGICRGCQLLNVACGGSLQQHIDSPLAHDQKAPRDYPFHAIFIEPDTALASIIGRGEIRVNSFHHQAAADLGQGLIISARTADGTVEAIESRSHRYMLGLQWHPETMNDMFSQRIFSSLVKASGH